MAARVHGQLGPDGDPMSYEAMLAVLRAFVVPGADAAQGLLNLIGRLGRAARAGGVKPEVLLTAFGAAWDQCGFDWSFRTGSRADLNRARAIDLLFDAYFLPPVAPNGADVTALPRGSAGGVE